MVVRGGRCGGGFSGVIVIDSTSFQVYGLISQEPYIYKSVTTETKSIKSLTSVSDKLWYNLYVGLTEQATCKQATQSSQSSRC